MTLCESRYTLGIKIPVVLLRMQKQIHIKMSQELHLKLKIEAAKSGVTLQDFVIRVISEHFLDKENKKVVNND
mgnify:FL=1